MSSLSESEEETCLYLFHIVQLPEPYGLVIVGGLQIDAQNINSMKELVSFIIKPLTQLLNA